MTQFRIARLAGVRLALFLIAALPLGAQAKDSSETAGDILAVALPATAYAATFALHDRDGRLQFYATFAAVALVTQGLKVTVKAERPDGSDDQSFPSGHTSTAFQAASFIRKRYGWQYAAPAYAAASYVGWSRVDAERHYTRDVLAGAVIGIVGAELLTTRWQGVAVTPMVAPGAVGVRVVASF